MSTWRDKISTLAETPGERVKRLAIQTVLKEATEILVFLNTKYNGLFKFKGISDENVAYATNVTSEKGRPVWTPVTVVGVSTGGVNEFKVGQVGDAIYVWEDGEVGTIILDWDDNLGWRTPSGGDVTSVNDVIGNLLVVWVEKHKYRRQA